MPKSETNLSWEKWESHWSQSVHSIAAVAMRSADPGHGIDHVSRVVRTAERLARLEHAHPMVVMPSAWLHDCVLVAKNSPERSKASQLAAYKAQELLDTIEYPNEFRTDIGHAIESHSFSAAIECQSMEAKVVQDADRLEALGAIGIARCLMTAGSLGQALYDINEPFPMTRIPDDRRQSIDHFFAKLFRLPVTMKTETGRAEALQRVDIMKMFLNQLAKEIGLPPDSLEQSLIKLEDL